MQELQALIFDVDGTLAETERDGHRPAFNRAFAEAGLDWEWDPLDYGRLLEVTGGKERILRYIEREGLELPPGTDRDALVARLHRDKTRHYVAMLSTGTIPLRPGVERLLREARAAGVRLAIATTTTPDNVTALLDHCGVAGLRDWFEVIAAGDAVPRKKPAPDIFELALRELKLPPEACVAVEDSDNGLRAALDAGLAAVVVTVNDYTERQCFTGATLVVDQLGEPARPARVLGGTLSASAMGDTGVVDLACLERLRRAAFAPPPTGP